MKKRYPPDRKLTLTCQGPLCEGVGRATYFIHLEETQHAVPSAWENRASEGKMDRYTLLKMECSKCGFTSVIEAALSPGCGWAERLKKEGVRRKDPKQRKTK